MRAKKVNGINWSIIRCGQEYDQEYDQEYESMTEREWVDLEFATIIYDYRLHPDAVKGIEHLFDRLVNSRRD